MHELEVVLADGSTATSAPRPARAPQGRAAEILRDHADRDRLPSTGASPRLPARPLARDFNLAKLVTGSEGTLVAITEATVGLVPLPKAKLFAVGHFHFAGQRSPPRMRSSRTRPRSR